MSRLHPRKSARTSLSQRVALLFAGAIALLLVIVPNVSMTEAAWTDNESATGSFTAMTLPALTAQPTCTTENIIIKRNARLNWTAPAGGLPAGMYYEVRLTNVTANPQITQSIFTTNTTTTLSDGLLSGLLSGILTGNATLNVQVYVAIPNITPNPTAAVWRSTTSPAAKVVQYQGGLLTGDFFCA